MDTLKDTFAKVDQALADAGVDFGGPLDVLVSGVVIAVGIYMLMVLIFD